MKGKTLQQRIIYPTRLSFRFEEIRSLEAKTKQAQHYQTSFIKNIKETSLLEKEKARTRNMKMKK